MECNNNVIEGSLEQVLESVEYVKSKIGNMVPQLGELKKSDQDLGPDYLFGPTQLFSPFRSSMILGKWMSVTKFI